jgi:hypothetical protein
VQQLISDALLALHIGYYLKLLNDLTVSKMLLLLLLADIIAKEGAAILVFPSRKTRITAHYLPHLKKQAIETWDFFYMFQSIEELAMGTCALNMKKRSSIGMEK